MFRITQSFLLNSFVGFLREKQWQVLYEDYVDGPRSGKGAQGVLCSCFKVIFDQFPDLVAAKGDDMLIIEVDLAFKSQYVKKLKLFKSKETDLLRCVNSSLHLDINSVNLGMVFQRKPNPAQTKELQGLDVWLYNINSSKFFHLNTTVSRSF